MPILLVIASIEGQGICLDVYSCVDTNGRHQNSDQKFTNWPINHCLIDCEGLLAEPDKHAIGLLIEGSRYDSNPRI